MVKNDNWITRIMSKWMSNFRQEHVNPASYDFTWSGQFRQVRSNSEVGIHGYPTINTWDKEDVKNIWGEVKETNELILSPFTLYLLDTNEEVTIPEEVMGLIFLKSSIARAGIEHLHAGLFDPGFSGTATLEVINLTPFYLKIRKGQRIVQMTFLTATPPLISYKVKGSYNGQKEPRC